MNRKSQIKKTYCFTFNEVYNRKYTTNKNVNIDNLNISSIENNIILF